MKLICFLKGIWKTIINLYPFSGHDFIEIYDNKDIQVLECKVCGHVSVGFKNEQIRREEKMKYQVLGHKRRLQGNDKPYEVVCEFDDLVQLYFMMDKVDKRIFNEVLVIDTYTNKLVASRELENTYVRNLHKRR